MDSIAILVLSCTQPKYADERMRIWESLKPLASKCHIFYLFGQSELPTIIPDHPNVFKLVADCGDYYEDIPRKMWYGYNFLYNTGYNGVIKIDENIEICDVDTFFTNVRSELALHDYIALRGVGHRQFPAKDDGLAIVSYYHRGKVHDKRLNYLSVVLPICHYAGGPCYALSRRALASLCYDDFERCLYEDYAVGSALSSRKINLHSSKLLEANMFVEKSDDTVIPPPHISTKRPLQIAYKPPPFISPHTVYVSVTGGLGNQLFMIAAGLGTAMLQNAHVRFVQMESRYTYYWDSILSGLSSLVMNTTDCKNIYNEPRYGYDSIPNTNTDIFIKGFFQSQKYFKGLRDAFRSIVRISNLRDYFLAKYDSRIFSDKAVIVHARRGDYVESQYKIDFHGPPTNTYYEKARDSMKAQLGSPSFLLISDDPTFWENNPVFLTENAIVVNEPELFIFYLMIQTKHFILANSSFSWWGAYLSQSTNIIAPEKWLGPNGPQDYHDVYLENWKLL